MREKLIEIDNLIKKAQISEASNLLERLDFDKIQRNDYVLYANLHRRLGNPSIALKTLRPFVRPSARNQQVATPDEILEYSMALIKLGAIIEAKKLIEKISAESHPLASLYLAFGEISSWNYKSARTHLEHFCQHPKAEPYYIKTAKINLLSCYSFLDEPNNARKIFDELKNNPEVKNYTLMYRHVLLLAAQVSLFERKWSETNSLISKVKDTYKDSDQKSKNYILAKWELILKLYMNGPTNESLADLNELRLKASSMNSPEFNRDLDMYEGIFFKDDSKLFRVYFGTPYESYKEKLINTYKYFHTTKLELPNEFHYYLPEGETSDAWIEIGSGKNSYSKSFLKKDSINQRILNVLSSDLYKNPNIYQLNDEAFDESYFNPVSTPNKVKQSIFRLNSWFDTNSIPLAATSSNQFYSLKSKTPIQIRVLLNDSENLELDVICKKLFTAVARNEFSSLQAMETLGVSRRTATRILKQLIHEKKALQTVKGPRSKYILAD